MERAQIILDCGTLHLTGKLPRDLTTWSGRMELDASTKKASEAFIYKGAEIKEVKDLRRDWFEESRRARDEEKQIKRDQKGRQEEEKRPRRHSQQGVSSRDPGPVFADAQTATEPDTETAGQIQELTDRKTHLENQNRKNEDAVQGLRAEAADWKRKAQNALAEVDRVKWLYDQAKEDLKEAEDHTKAMQEFMESKVKQRSDYHSLGMLMMAVVLMCLHFMPILTMEVKVPFAALACGVVAAALFVEARCRNVWEQPLLSHLERSYGTP